MKTTSTIFIHFTASSLHCWALCNILQTHRIDNEWKNMKPFKKIWRSSEQVSATRTDHCQCYNEYSFLLFPMLKGPSHTSDGHQVRFNNKTSHQSGHWECITGSQSSAHVETEGTAIQYDGGPGDDAKGFYWSKTLRITISIAFMSKKRTPHASVSLIENWKP